MRPARQARTSIAGLLGLAVVAVGLLQAALCGAQEAAARRTTTASQLPHLTVQLDWKPTAQFAGILMASQLGYYRAAGLDVTVAPADGTTATLPVVAAHTDTIGITEADVLLVGQAHGAQVKAFATMLQTTPFALITLQSSGITTIPELRGKTLGLHDDGQKALDVLLQFNHMTRADVRTQEIPYTTAPLVEGQVAALQGYMIDEAVRLRMEGHAVNLIRMADNGYVSYAEVLYASDALLQERPGDLAKFLRATGKGWRFAAEHPQATAQMIVSHWMPGANEAEQEASLRAVLPLLRYEDPRFGEMRDATWQQSLAMFARYQLVDRQLTLAQVVDDAVLRRVYGSKQGR